MKRPFLGTLWDRLGGRAESVELEPSGRYRLSGKPVRVPFRGLPFEVEMGRQRLQIHPDAELDESRRTGPPSFLLFDPERYLAGLGHFLRLAPGGKVTIRSANDEQRPLLSLPREAFRRHLQVRHEGDALVFSDSISELGTYLSVLADEDDVHRLARRRRRALLRIGEIYGGPLEPLAPAEALAVLAEVNRHLRDPPCRPKDVDGNAGALLEVPDELTPVVVGDLHARVDNLLEILSRNGVLGCLERGEAALLLLGDVVHPESEDELEDMDSSVLIMDLLLRLQIRFPGQIFVLLGNHDSFSTEIMKRGVPQGLLWRRRLRELRGQEYVEQMELYYQQLPLAARSQRLIAVHAGPPRARVTRESLVNGRSLPSLVHELTWNRARTRANPSGYGRGEVKRFRRSLEVARETPLIVGHQTVSEGETVWLNARQIPGYHVVFSARDEQVGAITWVGGTLVAQAHPCAPVLDWLNEQLRGRLAEPT